MTATSSHKVVLASAGSGKTFRLTHRFIGLLAAGSGPERILATTFTRKAAGEILQRLVLRLAESAGDPASLAELNTHAGTSLDGPGCGALLARLLASAHRLRVQTIDGLLGQLASVRTLELDAAPGWRIADDETDAELRLEAVDRMLDERPLEGLVELLRALHGGFGRGVHDTVLGWTKRSLDAYRRTEEAPEVWSWPVDPGPPLDEAGLLAAVGALRSLPIPRNKDGSEAKPWRGAIDKAIEAAGAEDWETFLTTGIASKIVMGAETYQRKAIGTDVVEAFAPLIDHARAALLVDFDERTRGARELVEVFASHYDHLRRVRGLCRFEDVPRMLLESGGVSGGGLDDLYFRLDGRVDHVLLDEFQDTSVEQFELLRPMLEEIVAHREGGRSVFIVGDAKQSLYTWRNAEPELLECVPKWLPALGPVETMQRNFRSSPVVLDAVNEVFAGVAENAALGESKAGQHWATLFQSHEAAKRHLPGQVTLRVGPDLGELSKPEGTEIAACEAVQRLHAMAPGALAAVLVRRRKPIAGIIGRLRAVGIHASPEGGAPLADASPVAGALSLLHFADHPGDTAARYHVATSPLGEVVGLRGWRDDVAADACARSLRERFASEGYAAVLHELGLAIAASTDGRGLIRYSQLVELAAEFDGAPEVSPSDLARIVRTRRVESSAPERVRVMTIHAAKGLEFDAVVLPELDGKWSIRPQEMLIDREDPLDPPSRVTVYAKELLRSLDPALAEMYHSQLDREVHEDLCGLYVAMTRAVHCLDMIVPAGTEKKGYAREPGLSAEGVLRAALAPDEPVEPGSVLWERGDAAWAEAFDKAAPVAGTDPIVVASRMRPSSGAPLSHVRRVSPSSLEGGSRQSATRWLTPMGEGASIGALMHHWFEGIEWIEDAVIDEATLVSSAVAADFASSLVSSWVGRFIDALGCSEISDALSRRGAANRLGCSEVVAHREWPFAIADNDAAGARVLLSGRFDRVVVGMRDGEPVAAEIVDFKTDALGDPLERSVEERMAFYRPQVEAYRRSLGMLLALDEDRIAASLAFTAAGRVEAIFGRDPV